jgi:hypothetical protein
VRLDDEKAICDTDDGVAVGVVYADDEATWLAPVPFDIERQPDRAAGPCAFAAELELDERHLRLEITGQVLSASPFPMELAPSLF